MNRRLLMYVAFLTAVFFWGVVLSFPDFFFFNPLDESSVLRKIQLVVSSAGWVLLSTGLPLVLVAIAVGHTRLIKVLPTLALVWPVGVASTQITLYFQTGTWNLGYLTTYPVFLVTEIVLPLGGLFLWRELTQHNAKSDSE